MGNRKEVLRKSLNQVYDVERRLENIVRFSSEDDEELLGFEEDLAVVIVLLQKVVSKLLEVIE